MQLYVLSDIPKIKNITKYSYLNIHIRRSNAHNCIYGFQSKQMLEHVKQMNKDAYHITEISMEDLHQYCRLSKDQLKIIRRCYSGLDNKITECEILNVRQSNIVLS